MSESHTVRHRPPQWLPYVAIGIGILAVSTAAIFIRLAQEGDAPSLVIAAFRMTVAALVLAPVTLRRYAPEVRKLTFNEIRLGLISGAFLGIHFATWITSLEYTSVVSSVVLVTTSPLWVALLSPFLLRERFGWWAFFGLLLALAGGILVGLSGEAGKPPTRSEPLLGNGLALLGAFAVAFYFIIGRRLRNKMSLVAYTWLVYSTAAVTLMVTALLSGQTAFGFAPETYLWMILMGLIPQLIGHSAFNYALGYLPAAYVSLFVLCEPIASGALAMLFLDEIPVPLQLLGSALILTGIAVTSREQSQTQHREPVISPETI